MSDSHNDELVRQTDEFLSSNNLEHLKDDFKNAEITVEDFRFLRQNPKFLKGFLSRIRDQMDVLKALEGQVVSQGTQVSMDIVIRAPTDLLEVCQHSDYGKKFLDKYIDAAGNKKFTAACRKLIKFAVVDYYFRLYRGHITQPTFFEMVSLIREELPAENPRVWYAPGVGKNSPTGYLYFRYRYIQQHDNPFSKTDNPPAVIPKMTVNAEIARKQWGDMTESEQNLCKGLRSKLNSIGFNRRKDIFELWSQTYPLRRYQAVTGTLKFSDWDVFKNFDSVYELISQDFRCIFPDDRDVLHDNVPDFVSRFSRLRHEYTSAFTDDKSLSSALDSIFVKDFDVSEFSILLAFYALSVILHKNFIYKGKKRFSVSLYDGCKSFIEILQTEAQILDTTSKKHRDAKAKGDTIQPYMIVIGSLEERKVESSYIIIDELTIPCNNMSTAIDLLLKSHYVFQLEYSPKCVNVYHFIERYFYNICDETEPCDASVLALISDFRRC